MRRPGDWTASSACFDVAYIPLSCRKASTQCSMFGDKRRSPFSLPPSKSLIRTVRGGYFLHFYPADCFSMQPNQHSHFFFKICTLCEVLPKAADYATRQGHSGNDCRDSPPLPRSQDWVTCETGSLSWETGERLLFDASITMSRP